MNGVIYAGLGIAGATALGSGLGLIVEKLPNRVFEVICSVAAGIMLYAAVVGLIVPAGEAGGCLMVSAGVLFGAMGLEKLNGYVGRLLPDGVVRDRGGQGVLLVLAIVVHHFPEGMAAGVSFGAGDTADTLAVCTGIALQNIPEAMMILPAMSMAGASGRMTALTALCSCGVEILGLCMGYVGVQLAAGVLPFLLAFAGGTMLYVVLSSMLTEDVYGLLAGFCGMMWI